MIRRTLLSLAFATLAAVTGCNGGGTSPPQLQTGRALLPQHLYVSGFNGVAQFDLPLSDRSTPNFMIGTPGFSIAVDKDGNLAIVNGDKMKFLRGPLSATSAPYAADVPSQGFDIAFSGSGELWSTGFSTSVVMYKPPFSGASSPSASIQDAAIVEPGGVVLDDAQNLYVANRDVTKLPWVGNVHVYAPPYTSAPIVTPYIAHADYAALAVSRTQLFVGLLRSASGAIDVYDLPITATSRPAFGMDGGYRAQSLAVDRPGNLYVAEGRFGTVSVYAPPFSATSSPVVTLELGRGFGISTIAIGP